MYSIKIKPLLVSLLISLGVGAIAGFLTSNSREIYQSLNLPALSPPGVVFPIVWTILYTLMGISAYLIYTSSSPGKDRALNIYALQLALNFIWPLLFFGAQQYLLSFIWILILWVAIIAMIAVFYKVSPAAAYLQIPYLLWVTFAAYLNLSVFLLN